MESTIRQTNAVKFELDVAMTQEEIGTYLDAAYREARKHATLKGFRKGNVPISMIKKLYGRQLENEAFEEAVQKEFRREMTERQIEPIGSPAITRMDREENGGLAFTVAYEVLPAIELKDYKGLNAQKVYHEITDEEIQHELNRLRESRAQTAEEAVDSVSDENHVVRATFQKMENDEPVVGNTMDDVAVNLARTDINPNLRAALLNTKVGDTFRIDLPTGDESALVNYLVTVNAIHRTTMPEIDDALAASLMGREDATLAELTDAVRNGIKAEYDRRYAGYFRDQLVANLVDRNPFDVPEAIVAEVMKSFVEDMRRGKNKELPKDFDLQRFVTEMRPTAERTAKWALLRDLLIEKEGLVADDADYEGLAEIESQRIGVDYDMLLNHFRKSEKIEERILAEKAMQFLEDYAVVQEIEDRDLPVQEQHDHSHDHDHGDHEHAHDHEHGSEKEG